MTDVARRRLASAAHESTWNPSTTMDGLNEEVSSSFIRNRRDDEARFEAVGTVRTSSDALLLRAGRRLRARKLLWLPAAKPGQQDVSQFARMSMYKKHVCAALWSWNPELRREWDTVWTAHAGDAPLSAPRTRAGRCAPRILSQHLGFLAHDSIASRFKQTLNVVRERLPGDVFVASFASDASGGPVEIRAGLHRVAQVSETCLEVVSELEIRVGFTRLESLNDYISSSSWFLERILGGGLVDSLEGLQAALERPEFTRRLDEEEETSEVSCPPARTQEVQLPPKLCSSSSLSSSSAVSSPVLQRARSLLESELKASPPAESLNYAYDFRDAESILQFDPTRDTKTPNPTWWDPCNEAGIFKVRGPTYLRDGVKVPSKPSAMECVAARLLTSSTPFQWATEQDWFRSEHEGKGAPRPFLFVINFFVPGFCNMTLYMAQRRGEAEDPVFQRMLRNFCTNESDAYRNDRLKIIPGVTRGLYLARKVVGATPAILGRKITIDYRAAPNAFECSVNVGSSSVAMGILNMVKKLSSDIDVQLAFLFESKDEDELPERLMGGYLMHNPRVVG